MSDFLTVQKTRLVHKGRDVRLCGVNLGGWLMMEGYILQAPNQPEHLFKARLSQDLGPEALADFEESFRRSFIREEDFRLIRDWGMNCLRLPFNCRLVEKPDGPGVRYLDTAVRWARQYGLWVVLDLHAAWGAQNQDWHSDSSGEARLWHSPADQKRTLALWAFLAQRYHDEPTVAGYDLLNEAVVQDAGKLNAFYREAIRVIRGVDKNHVIFVEGNQWATDLGCLERFDDDNLALSIHYYEPLEMTFNLVPGLVYPLSGQEGVFDQEVMRRRVAVYAKLARKYEAPVLVGEFGVNARDGHYGEDRWVADFLAVLAEEHFHWTYWTYKAVKNSLFPDGILSYRANPPWVNRQGPKLGWETYSALWPQRQKEMVQSWHSEAFVVNEKILAVLKKAAHRP